MKRIVSIFLLLAVAFSFSSCDTNDAEAKSEKSKMSAVIDFESVKQDAIGEVEKLPDTMTIQLAGDFLIHKSVFSQAKTGDRTYDFTPYVSLFKDVFVSDFNVLNLENPVDAKGNNEGISNYPSFNAPIECLDAVKRLNIDACITANNHTCDKGFSGLVKTLENIKSKGLDAVGTYATEEDSKKVYIRDVNGIKVGIVPFTGHVNGWKSGGEYDFAVNIAGREVEDVEVISKKIKEIRAAGAEFVIVTMHWGAEYVDSPSSQQKKIARALCENGADVIMGSHSHCVQPIEVMEVTRNGEKANALIIYSLGNFFANQTGLEEPKTQGGIVVSIKATRKENNLVSIDNAFYMPTYTFETGGTGADFIRIVPSGKYAFAEERPEIFENKYRWNLCKNSWEHVTDVVGDEIACVASPDDYPDGFFKSVNN